MQPSDGSFGYSVALEMRSGVINLAPNRPYMYVIPDSRS